MKGVLENIKAVAEGAITRERISSLTAEHRLQAVIGTLHYISGIAAGGLSSSPKDSRRLDLTGDEAQRIVQAMGMCKRHYCYPGAGVILEDAEGVLLRRLDMINQEEKK